MHSHNHYVQPRALSVSGPIPSRLPRHPPIQLCIISLNPSRITSCIGKRLPETGVAIIEKLARPCGGCRKVVLRDQSEDEHRRNGVSRTFQRMSSLSQEACQGKVALHICPCVTDSSVRPRQALLWGLCQTQATTCLCVSRFVRPGAQGIC
jgi:hypothetical protein